MAPASAETAAALVDFLRKNHADIPLCLPTDADFEASRLSFVKRPAATPLAIARPQSEADVQTLVHACRSHSVDFVVRTGGHDCVGRSQVDGVVTIDMRALKHVVVDEATQTTARVGGGITLRDLARGLGERGLATPMGTIASVGYVGWSTLGGFGPFSAQHGLGVDQIVGAKLVNAAGELVVVEGDHELLTGLRGGGGSLGIVVELTIKVYPSKGLLSGLVLYAPGDFAAAWQALATALQGWLDQAAMPASLYVQPYAGTLPGLGRLFGALVTWVAPDGGDNKEANEWLAKVAAVYPTLAGGPPPHLEAKSVLSFLEDDEKLVPYGHFGSAFSISLKSLSPQAAAVLAKHSVSGPDTTAIPVHTLRASMPNQQADASVFAARAGHVMIELVATSPDENEAKEAERWAQDVVHDLRAVEPGNILAHSSVVLPESSGEQDYRVIYGEKYEVLVALKGKYDPDNVFKYAVPRLL